MIKFLKGFFYIIIIFFILAISTIVNKEIAKILVSILSFSISLYLGLIILNLINKYNIWSDEKDLKKERKKKSLYQWMSLEFDEKYLYDLLKRKKAKTDLENLKEIRDILKKSIGDNLEDYYLYKSYLEWSSQHSFFNGLKFLGPTIVTSFLTTILTQGILFDKVKILFNNEVTFADKIVQMFNLSAIGISLLIVIILIFAESTKNKKKLELTKVIVNEIIREKEKNQIV